MYSINNDLYSEAGLTERSSCDNWNSYQWGFSFLLLLIFTVISTIWTIGMYSMWMDAYWNSRLDRSHRAMGFFRGVMDASHAMRKDMGEDPTAEASESEIKAMVARGRNGGQVSFEALDQHRLPLSRRAEFRQWRKAIPSLNGWTYPWTSLHWAWVTVFFTIGVLIFLTPPISYANPPVIIGFLLLLVGLCSTLRRRWKLCRESGNKTTTCAP
jgi:hypothetical protein